MIKKTDVFCFVLSKVEHGDEGGECGAFGPVGKKTLFIPTTCPKQRIGSKRVQLPPKLGTPETARIVHNIFVLEQLTQVIRLPSLT